MDIPTDRAGDGHVQAEFHQGFSLVRRGRAGRRHASGRCPDRPRAGAGRDGAGSASRRPSPPRPGAGLPAAVRASRRRGAVAEVYQKAQQVLYPICRVCPDCDGVACAGEYPGIGGVWSGASFQNNYNDLRNVKLKLRPLNAVSSQDKKPDTSTVIFGQKLSLPAMAAPIGGTGRELPESAARRRVFRPDHRRLLRRRNGGAIGDGRRTAWTR